MKTAAKVEQILTYRNKNIYFWLVLKCEVEQDQEIKNQAETKGFKITWLVWGLKVKLQMAGLAVGTMN